MSTGPEEEQETPWLSPAESEAWRALVALVLLLPGRLDAQLQRDSGVSLFDYLVLSSMSMAPDRTLGMSELARLANGSLSRLSNVVKRFEQHGWVRRSPLPDDRRVTVATLTDAGLAVVVAAAPGHVRRVRELVIDPLSAEQLEVVGAVGARITARILDPDDPCSAETDPAC